MSARKPGLLARPAKRPRRDAPDRDASPPPGPSFASPDTHTEVIATNTPVHLNLNSEYCSAGASTSAETPVCEQHGGNSVGATLSDTNSDSPPLRQRKKYFSGQQSLSPASSQPSLSQPQATRPLPPSNVRVPWYPVLSPSLRAFFTYTVITKALASQYGLSESEYNAHMTAMHNKTKSTSRVDATPPSSATAHTANPRRQVCLPGHVPRL